MKRPALVVAVNVMQLLLALFLAGIAVDLLFLTRTAEIRQDADAIHALRIGAAVLGLPGLLWMAAVAGMWRGKLWGWGLALLLNVAMLGAFVYSMLGDNSVEMDDIGFSVVFLVFSIFLVIPKVRKFYWKAQEPQSAVSGP